MNWDSLFFLQTRKRIPVFVVGITTASFLSFQTNGFSNGPTMCLFRLSTGLFCPFCGTTRSIGEILQGDPFTAASLNLYGFVLVALVISWVIKPTFVSELYEKVVRFKINSTSFNQTLMISAFGIYSVFKFLESNDFLIF
jgi:hypothetical protein